MNKYIELPYISVFKVLMYDCVKFDFSRIVMDLKTLMTQMDTCYFDMSESYFRRQAT